MNSLVGNYEANDCLDFHCFAGVGLVVVVAKIVAAEIEVGSRYDYATSPVEHLIALLVALFRYCYCYC